MPSYSRSKLRNHPFFFFFYPLFPLSGPLGSLVCFTYKICLTSVNFSQTPMVLSQHRGKDSLGKASQSLPGHIVILNEEWAFLTGDTQMAEEGT